MSNIAISKEAASFIESVKTCKGQFIQVAYKTNLKLAAAKAKEGYSVVKEVHGIFRTGIDYANLGTVKAGIESGDRKEVGELPWGEWAAFPWIIAHKGAEYVRLYPVKGQRSESRFGIFLNGEQVILNPGQEIKREIAKLQTPAEAEKLLNPDRENLECITKKLSDVEFIGCWHNTATDEQIAKATAEFDGKAEIDAVVNDAIKDIETVK